MALDLAGRRLFVAALGAGSIEVLDLRAGARTSRIDHVREPQGVSYVAGSRRLFVAEGGGRRVSAFADLKPLEVVEGLDDADNMRLDALASRLYVGYGHALAIVDPQAMRMIGQVPLAGHPEAFELATAGPQIYVNVPSAGQVAVVDRSTAKVAATWKVPGAGRNFAMALDEREQQLFVATRHPGRLVVFEALKGSIAADIELCDDADDLFYDSERRQLYAVCGEGAIDVVRVDDSGHFKVIERLPSPPGTRTGLFVPQLATLFVAAPARDRASAEIRAYKVR